MPIDYKKYPANWKTEIRPAILHRAGNKCEGCGVVNHSIIHRFGKGINEWMYYPEGMEGEAWAIDGKKAVKVVLTIAHVDHDILNNDPSNLRAWCQRCHNAHDADYRRGNRKRKRSQPSLFGSQG
jgi:hypothetical protein